MIKTLIVEDSASFRQTFAEMSANRVPSAVVEEAAECREALKKIDVFRPDIIFMDIHLPQGNGLELTTGIKARYPQTAIAVLTWHHLPEYRRAAHRNGAHYFFSKGSVTAEEICSLVESVSSAS